MTTRNRTVALLVLTLLIATGLRVWNLDTQSIWFDEGFSWHAASQPSLIATLNGDPTNPPLYYLLLHVWIRLVGDSEFGLRSLSLLQGIVLVAGIVTVSKRHFGTLPALLAGGVAVFMPLLWWASQEARMYNTLALAVLLMTAGYLELQTIPRSRWGWIALVIGELGALYTHNTGIIFLGGVNLVFSLGWLAQIGRHRAQAIRIRHWIMSQALIAIGWLPELLARFQDLGSANAALRTPPELTPVLLWQSWQALWANSWDMVLDAPLVLQTSAVILAILALVGLIAAFQCPIGRTLAALLSAFYGVLILALTVLGVHLHGRYLVALAPIALILITSGFYQISKTGRRQTAIVAFVVATAVVWVALPGQANVKYQHDHARAIVEYYTRRLESNDRVLTWSYAQRYELVYYANRLGLQAPIVSLPEGADLDEIRAILSDSLPTSQSYRAEINTWYTQASDRRGMLPCLIGHNNPQPQEAYTVQGMTSRTYNMLSAPTLPTLVATSENFGPARLTGIGVPTESNIVNRGLCVPVEITLQTVISQDLGVTVRALNTNGQEIASADAPLLTPAQVPTSRLRPGDTASAFPLLYFPQGTPPGSYSLSIRIYSAEQPTGLDRLDPNSGAPTGKDLQAGAITLTAADWPAFEGDCDLPLGQGLTLTNCTELGSGDTLQAGTSLPLTLALQISTQPSSGTLTLAGGDWQTTTTLSLSDTGAVLAWPVLPIPAHAQGSALLTFQNAEGSEIELARYTIARSEHIMTPPDTDMLSGAQLGTLTELYGFSLGNPQPSAGDSFAVKLVWRALNTSDTPYTVTVQLLSPNGVLLAQHDSQPAAGNRPTSGWISGEYVEDQHVLDFREEYRDYTGPATLIVALYDPASGARLTAQNGADYIILQNPLEITPP